MSAPIVDTHAHIHHRQFADDADAVMLRAVEAGVERIVLIGTDAEDTRRALQLARRHRGHAFVAAGLHPHDADKWGPDEEHALRHEFLPDPLVIAIGEMGLDYYYKDKCDRANERRAFLDQMTIARDTGRPIVIHCRDAYDELLPMVADTLGPVPLDSPVRGVMHCWAGNPNHAQQAVQLGFLLGIGGAVTFPRSTELREICALVGLQNLVLETDAPYISPVPHRGQRNEPARLVHVVDTLAQIFGQPPDQIRESTTSNAHRLYPLLP
jgi:TatD DNase family protein